MNGILTSALEHLRRFFGWWTSELLACVPPRLRAMIGARIQQLVIVIADKTVTFEHIKGKTGLWLGNLDLSQSSPAGQRETVREIIKDAKLDSAQVVLRLPRASALRRTVDLPAPALENLREVLTFEMDRHTPFESDEVYFDYHVTSQDLENKQIKVDLAVMTKEVADRALGLVSGWGLEPDKLALSDRLEGEQDFNLLPRSATGPTKASSYRFSGLLGLIIAVLLIIAVAVPLQDKKEALADADVRLRQARTEAAEANEMTRRLKEMAERSSFVLAQKRDRFSAIEILNEVTARLPDDTWVLQFGRRANQLTVSGYSVKSSALIALLEGSDMLSQVKFTSPVTFDPRVGRERFNIAAKVPEKPGT